MASFCRQDRCIVAPEVKMSLDFHWVRREDTGKYAVHRPKCVSDMMCDEGHRAAPCTWIRHGLRELPGKPVVHLPFARMAKAMEDDSWGSTVRNAVRNIAQISRVHRGDRCMQLFHLWLQVVVVQHSNYFLASLNGWARATCLTLLLQT